MDTANVVLGGDIGRLTFRWVFDEPQTVSSEPAIKYYTRQETIEFRCADSLYRIFNINFLDSRGRSLRSETMRPPYKWQRIQHDSVMTTIAIPACELINRKNGSLERKQNDDEQKEVARFFLSFVNTLEQTRDFQPIIDRFFARHFLDGYLADSHMNWFVNLDRATAGKAKRSELQRYYVAILNAAYLSGVYFISHIPETDETNSEIVEARLLPDDVLQFVSNHPYTSRYKGKTESFDYLAERIDSIPRMRSYTDLMEGIAGLMRKHVASVRAEQSVAFHEFLEELDEPTVRTCSTDCLGWPRGTKLIEINVAIFHLEVTKVNGQLKIVSLVDQASR